MEKGTMSVAEGVNADQGFGTLWQWLQIVQYAAQKLGFLEQLPQIVQYTADNLIFYQNLNRKKAGHVTGDLDVYRFLDEQFRYLIKLKCISYFREGIIDDNVIKLAVDIACKACLVMGSRAGIKSVELKDSSQLTEQGEYLNIINGVLCKFQEYVMNLCKSYKDNDLHKAIQNAIKELNLENSLKSEDLKYYNFYREFLFEILKPSSNLFEVLKQSSNQKETFDPTMPLVILSTRMLFTIAFKAKLGYLFLTDNIKTSLSY
jgi:hypothetical protein